MVQLHCRRIEMLPDQGADFKYTTASPANGAVNVRFAPPLIVPPFTVLPVEGLNHSTVRLPDVELKLIVTEPPEGK